MTKATVICDASYRNDQGTQFRSFAGWAAWVRDDGYIEAIEGYGPLDWCDRHAKKAMREALKGAA